MAGANPEVRGHPGASGKPDIRRGNPVCRARCRNAAPTCRRCGGPQRWAGDAPPQARCAMSLSPQRRGRTTGGRRPPRDLPGLRGRHRQQPGAEPTAAARRLAEAGKRSRRFRARPDFRRPRRTARRTRSRPLPGTASRSRRIGRQPNRHRRANRGTAAAPTTCCKALDGPSKLSHPTPVPAAMRPRRGRSVPRVFLHARRRHQVAARSRGRRLAAGEERGR